VGFCTLILFRRDLRTATFFVGILVNEVINYILKKTIKEARPELIKGYKTDYGMPSSHSQFMFFFATHLLLLILYRRLSFTNQIWGYIYAVLAYVVAATVALSRVYLGYHTLYQVLVGCTMGCVIAPFWLLITEKFIRPVLFPFVESMEIAKFLYIRDTSDIPDITKFEYDAVMQIRKKQHTKKK